MGEQLEREETRAERLKRRDEDIVAMYKELSKKKFAGQTLYRHDAIISQVAYKFYLSCDRTESIIYGTSTDYKTDSTT